MEEFLQVGAIANTHGIAGEVKIFPMTDDIQRFKKLKEVYLDTGKERMLLHVASCKFVKNQPILKFQEFHNINQVEGFKRCGLFVTRDQAVPLGKDEYFIADLIGLKVIREENGQFLGELKEVLRSERCLCRRDGRWKRSAFSGDSGLREKSRFGTRGSSGSCDERIVG